MKRIALIGENSVEYINILIDIWNSGNCAVLIDCQIPPQTAVEMMHEAQVRKCYIEYKYYDKIYAVLDKKVELIPYEKENTSARLLPTETYDRFQENYSKDEAVVIYSSGTTGKSKGIILSHFAINTNADAIIDYMQPDDSDRMYIVKNLTHSSSITGELLIALKTKMALLIAPVVVPPRYVLENVVKYGVTIIGVNPPLLAMYCKECESKKYDLSTLKKIYISGALLNDKIYETAHKVFQGQEIYNAYGLSEAGPRVTAQRRDCSKGNSVGKVIKGVELIIVDESGNVVPNGERGIVHINTPSRFNGYIQGEIKHKSLYQDWLNAGDIGYLDGYNELHVIGRIDDMIVIGAHKIYPAEVERLIQAAADVYECVVALVDIQGEDVLCCLYASNEEMRADIKNILGTGLMKYEIPKLFVRTGAIPKTRNGKISSKGVKETIKRELEGRNNV